MARCEKCGRVYLSTAQFKYIDYQGQQLLVCPYCIKESKIEKNYQKSKLGWMWLLIAVLVVFFPLFTFLTIIYSWNEAIIYDLFNLYPKFYIVSIFDIIISFGLVIFSIYAGLLLYSKKDNALYTAKAFLIVYLIYSLTVPFLLFFVDFPNETILIGDIANSIFGSFIFFGVWYWFLTSSKTINRIFFEDKEIISDSNRTCPNCKRDIPFDAVICPYCKYDFYEIKKEAI